MSDDDEFAAAIRREDDARDRAKAARDALAAFEQTEHRGDEASEQKWSALDGEVRKRDATFRVSMAARSRVEEHIAARRRAEATAELAEATAAANLDDARRRIDELAKKASESKCWP